MAVLDLLLHVHGHFFADLRFVRLDFWRDGWRYFRAR
jgi:hypothetical protein